MSTHRGVVYSNHGGAAAAQPLAVSAALSVLQRGGSFIDAAIAASSVLAVIEPAASHIGGDAFLVTHSSATKENLAFNGSGAAPERATAEAFVEGIPHHGYKSATIPGLVSTWFAAHEKFGRLSFEEILSSAIGYADQGFPAYEGFVNRMRLHISNYPTSTIFTDMGISTDINLGDIVIQKDLAQTLRSIAALGRSAFYSGCIAEKISAETGGWISASDLSNHQTRILNPLSVKYRDLNIYGQPPPSQGVILMEELLLAGHVDLKSMTDADRIHFMVESKKLAFEDRFRILGDPELVKVDVHDVLNEDHIKKRFECIDMKAANNSNSKQPDEGSDTTYFLVADNEGNAVSWIQSVYHNYGSDWVAKGTGILFNNRMTGFSTDPKSPNCVAPLKRPAHTLNAWIATNSDGSLKYVGGTPGANVQVQSNFQLISNMVDLGMNVQQACEAPRWQHLSTRGQEGFDEETYGTLELESRFPAGVVEELMSRGHVTKDLGPWGHFSSVQLLEVFPNGTYAFGSDPRAEGHAAGY